MSLLPDDVRREFGRECYSYVKVTPRGFDIDDEIAERLRGRVVKAMVIRKLFEDDDQDDNDDDDLDDEDA